MVTFDVKGRPIKKNIFKNAQPLFTICLGLGFAITLISGINKEQLRFAGWLRDLAIYVIFCEIIGFSNLITCNLLPEMGRIKSKSWQQIYLAGEFILASLVGTFLSLALTSWLLRKQIPRIGLAPFVLMIVGFSILASYAIFFYLQMKDRLQAAAVQIKERELHAERMEKLKAAAELSALQSRIQPHFLFNTLNSIAALIREDPTLAEATTEKLAELFRHVLDSNRHEYITLGEEMSIIRHYLEIENLRLGERLRFRIDMDAALEDLRVPGLIIQPLVENSIKHGIAPLEEGGEVLITANSSGGTCSITVQDSGAGFDEAHMSGGYGLQNIRDRLKNLYGETAQFSMSSGPGKGARVEIILPWTASEK